MSGKERVRHTLGFDVGDDVVFDEIPPVATALRRDGLEAGEARAAQRADGIAKVVPQCVEHTRLPYSDRSAMTGSARAARRGGRAHAVTLITAKPAATAPYV